MSKTGARLRWFEIGTACVHLIGFGVSLSFMKHDKVVPLRRGYIVYPQSGSNDAFSFGTVHTSTISCIGLISAFFALSFVFQFVPAAFLWENTYYRLTKLAIQPYRWIEYSFSASCLFLTGALLDGVIDYYLVLTMFALMWTVMFFGLLQEVSAFYLRRMEQLGHKWHRNLGEFLLPTILGWPPYGFLWAIAFDNYALVKQHATNSPPNLLLAFFVFEFVGFSSFGFNQLLQMLRMYRLSPDDTKRLASIAVQHEYAYAILSLTSKTVGGAILLHDIVTKPGHYPPGL